MILDKSKFLSFFMICSLAFESICRLLRSSTMPCALSYAFVYTHIYFGVWSGFSNFAALKPHF